MGDASVIAIDGPVASGKTAVGRLLAQRLGYRFLDTGTMYRALTWIALKEGTGANDSPGLARLARKRRIEVVFQQNRGVSLLVDGQDVTPHLRRPEVERQVSLVAQVAGVRKVLSGQQRRIARDGPVVMAGRDIGTVVLADAPLKVFLAASVEERARRRYSELHSARQDTSFQQVLEELEERDRLDTNRKVAPLRQADDAVTIDTDGLSVEQVVERILGLVRQR
ncbi:MAG: (d)CMP kinase [Chloroflexi bacterium]|nr:(d)CMP kinase [Chloroflexota bacterium]